MNTCHKCNSSLVIKRGIHGNKQRFRCKECGYQSVHEHLPDTNECKKKLLRAICLFLSSLYKNSVAKLMDASCQAICGWIIEMGKYEKLMPKPTGELVSLELDEMWHFHNEK